MDRGVPPEVEELLTGDDTVAHLATSRDDRPHVAPLWYRYEDGTVEIMTTGKKLANARANARVALSVQQAEDGHPEWMVTVRGTATVVEDAEENREANRRINRKYGADQDDWSENTLVRIDVGSVSYQIY
jgi:nitroimidazol reductase NimA-like FMN-containing flavoprotein (pyridoxamine 5'-phosphate oxidase superfamily)